MPVSAALRARLVRYGELRPCTNAFIDFRSPGSDRKENFTIIGPEWPNIRISTFTAASRTASTLVVPASRRAVPIRCIATTRQKYS